MQSSNRNTATENTVTSTVSTGCTVFPAFVMSARSALSSGIFVANVNLGAEQFERTRYGLKIERDKMPTYPVGSLVAIVASGICSHIGVIADELEDDVAPSFGMVASAMQSEVPLNPLRLKPQQGQLPYEYAYVASTEKGEFYGGIRRLSRQEADHLRALIGPFAPDAYLNTFWNEAERRAIQANAQETKRHQAALSSLLKQVESLGA